MHLSIISAVEVAPYVGAWIETVILTTDTTHIVVAPYVGAWIETGATANMKQSQFRRTLRGCVD